MQVRLDGPVDGLLQICVSGVIHVICESVHSTRTHARYAFEISSHSESATSSETVDNSDFSYDFKNVRASLVMARMCKPTHRL